MSQHDYNIANQTGLEFRQDLNNALEAIVTQNSGATEPITMFPGMEWLDTSVSPPVKKRRNQANNGWDLAVPDYSADSGSELVGFTQSGTGAVARTVQDKLREVVSVKDFGAVGDGITDDTAAWGNFRSQNQLRIVPNGRYLVNGTTYDYQHGAVITGRAVVSNTNWDPDTDRIFSRSTPDRNLLAVGGHYDELGSAGRKYQWGISSWISNPGTMPVTVIDAVSQGWRVRGGGMTARQCGDDGDGHALEILSGQWAARATVTATEGSSVLSVTNVTFKGSKFCVGNAISGNHIPDGATIVSVTKGSQTITGNAVETMTVVSGGTGYVVGDIVSLVGGTSTITAQARVRTVGSGGVILTLLVIEGGNYTVDPAGTLNITGGSGSGATVTVTMIRGGFGYPDSIQISAPATGSGSSNITVLSADTMGIALLVSGSGDGGSDGTGNPNGRGIQFQSYGNAAFLYGINFGASALRSNGTGIQFASGTAKRGISFESYNLEQAFRISEGSFTNLFQVAGSTCSGSAFSFSTLTAASGLNFSSSCSFSTAAIVLSGQNIATDSTTGMIIATNPTQKIGFWGRTPVSRPNAIASPTGGVTVDTEARSAINSILTALRDMGLIAG